MGRNIFHKPDAFCCMFRCRFKVEPSFVVCENLMFGRRSYKGFNPEIEVTHLLFMNYVSC